jgi:transcriptional regulator with XRE-family HTH domain
VAREPNLLGEFLRARRELMQPTDGMAGKGRRRVQGLRREEVALLAGVSPDYYMHLEQGRNRHPSEEVVVALARVLHLDDDALAYLRRLAAPRAQRGPVGHSERVSPGMLQILGAWSKTAAIVQGRFRDVLACTSVAAALHPGLLHDRNTVRLLFLDPDERAMHPEWERDARDSVSWLRAAAIDDLDNPRLNELVGELALKSEEFGRIWARHDVRKKSSGSQRLIHPVVGELQLGYETFSVNGNPSQSLTLYYAPSGRDAETLAALAEHAAETPFDESVNLSGNVILLDDRRPAGVS